MEKESFSILIIEDQKFCTDLFRAAFGQYTILAAESGAEGMQLFQSHHPHIVFLDIGLPDISGFEILEKLRQLDSNAAIVMLSALNNEAYVRRCRELGATGFLTKPYQKGYIQSYIEQAKAK